MSNQRIQTEEGPIAQGQNGAKQKNESKTGNGRKKVIRFSVLAPLLLAGAIYGWNWYSFAQSHEPTYNAQIGGSIRPVIPTGVCRS